MRNRKAISIVCGFLTAIGIAACFLSLVDLSAVYQGYAFMTASTYFPAGVTDIGTIPTGGKKHFAIKFVNNHPTRLHVIRVATSCGCTVASAKARSVAAFRTSTITGYVTPHVDGKSMKEVELVTDRGTSLVYLAYTGTNPDRALAKQ